MLDAHDYQIAIIVEGRNDYLSEVAWSPRYVRVIQALERQGILVIRLVAGTTRPLLDFEARWNAAGPVVAGGWYSDAVHASVAGQVVEAEMATTLLLGLMK